MRGGRAEDGKSAATGFEVEDDEPEAGTTRETAHPIDEYLASLPGRSERAAIDVDKEELRRRERRRREREGKKRVENEVVPGWKKKGILVGMRGTAYLV